MSSSIGLRNSYLVDSPECEHASIRKLESLLKYLTEFFASLDLSTLYSWFLLEFDMADLVKSFRGDVDILAGPLEARDKSGFWNTVAKHRKIVPNANAFYLAALEVAESGGIEWPPRTDYLVAIEAKCSYFDPIQRSVKSRKSSDRAVRKLREQIARLLDMGFDKVSLLDFIANPPASGVGSQPWDTAFQIGYRSMQDMSEVLTSRLPNDSLAGNWACSIGAVAGADEAYRGSPVCIEFKRIRDNLFPKNSAKFQGRYEMERNLRTILEDLPAPRSFPILFIKCRLCRKVHRSYLDDPCNAHYHPRSDLTPDEIEIGVDPSGC